jgi:hypothetical protein
MKQRTMNIKGHLLTASEANALVTLAQYEDGYQVHQDDEATPEVRRLIREGLATLETRWFGAGPNWATHREVLNLTPRGEVVAKQAERWPLEVAA